MFATLFSRLFIFPIFWCVRLYLIWRVRHGPCRKMLYNSIIGCYLCMCVCACCCVQYTSIHLDMRKRVDANWSATVNITEKLKQNQTIKSTHGLLLNAFSYRYYVIISKVYIRNCLHTQVVWNGALSGETSRHNTITA